MTRTQTWLARLVLLCLPFLCSGCLEYREVLTLDPQGSGSLEAELSLDLGLLRELSGALGEDLAPEELAAPSEAEFRAMLQAEGVQLQELAVESQGGRTWARFRLEFEDLDALHRLEAFSLRRQLAIFDHGQGRVLLVSRFDPRQLVPRPEDLAGANPEQAAALAEVAERIRSSLRLESELRLPGGVLASNGEIVQPGRDVSWRFDLASTPTFGQEEARLKVLCEASALPWADRLEPTPPEAGPVEADALAPIAPGAPVGTVAAGVREAPAAPSAPAGRGGDCSLGTQPAPGWQAFLWALFAGFLVLTRRSAA